jgi:hypothetical protein
MARQPAVKVGEASANGRPRGSGVGGVVRKSPAQMPSIAPRAEKMKIIEV